MTILREENNKLSWFHRYKGLALHTRSLCNIALHVELHLGQYRNRTISISFFSIKRNLNINHSSVIFKHSLIQVLALNLLYIHKEITAFNLMFTSLKGFYIVAFKKINHILKEWIQSHITFQILKFVNYHNTILLVFKAFATFVISSLQHLSVTVFLNKLTVSQTFLIGSLKALAILVFLNFELLVTTVGGVGKTLANN